jgi:class 3 adenylate cyclase
VSCHTDRDYYGLTVIIAARIASEAGPGQVLVGDVATANDKPEGVRYEEVPPGPLKGVARPVKIFPRLPSGDLAI